VCDGAPVRVITPSDPPPTYSDPDAVVIVDTGSWSQLEPVQEWLKGRHAEAMIVDHHVQGDEAVAPVRHIDTKSASACQIVAELCRRVLGIKSIGELPAEVAHVLYLGVASDTGWFRHSNVSPEVMHAAAELLRAGADHVRLYQLTEQQSTAGRLKLQARALDSLRLLDGGRLAVMMLSLRDYESCGAEPGESGGLVDLPQTIPTVQVTALLTEVPPQGAGSGPMTKISLRSKPPGARGHAVDVNVVTRALGGGGHVRAAGARVAMTMEQTQAEVLRLVSQQTATWNG
jgi:phosphoesterase RecJ-like protein